MDQNTHATVRRLLAAIRSLKVLHGRAVLATRQKANRPAARQ
jgi:hypothetical protein